jgi:hypothetical protein
MNPGAKRGLEGTGISERTDRSEGADNKKLNTNTLQLSKGPQAPFTIDPIYKTSIDTQLSLKGPNLDYKAALMGKLKTPSGTKKTKTPSGMDKPKTPQDINTIISRIQPSSSIAFSMFPHATCSLRDTFYTLSKGMIVLLLKTTPKTLVSLSTYDLSLIINREFQSFLHIFENISNIGNFYDNLKEFKLHIARQLFSIILPECQRKLQVNITEYNSLKSRFNMSSDKKDKMACIEDMKKILEDINYNINYTKTIIRYPYSLFAIKIYDGNDETNNKVLDNKIYTTNSELIEIKPDWSVTAIEFPNSNNPFIQFTNGSADLLDIVKANQANEINNNIITQLSEPLAKKFENAIVALLPRKKISGPKEYEFKLSDVITYFKMLKYSFIFGWDHSCNLVTTSKKPINASDREAILQQEIDEIIISEDEKQRYITLINENPNKILLVRIIAEAERIIPDLETFTRIKTKGGSFEQNTTAKRRKRKTTRRRKRLQRRSRRIRK